MLVGGGGVLSVSLETVLRPLHLHRTVHDKLQEAGGQEVQGEHPALPHQKKKKRKSEAVNQGFFFTMGNHSWAISDTQRWKQLNCSQQIYHKQQLDIL